MFTCRYILTFAVLPLLTVSLGCSKTENAPSPSESPNPTPPPAAAANNAVTMPDPTPTVGSPAGNSAPSQASPANHNWAPGEKESLTKYVGFMSPLVSKITSAQSQVTDPDVPEQRTKFFAVLTEVAAEEEKCPPVHLALAKYDSSFWYAFAKLRDAEKAYSSSVEEGHRTFVNSSDELDQAIKKLRSNVEGFGMTL